MTRGKRLLVVFIVAVIVLLLLAVALSFVLFELGGGEPTLRR
ncbi:MAG: hypothetical protein WKF65_04725 [Gaiellaceae bacterium]|jgi:flagellar basal body-associated protein FliL